MESIAQLREALLCIEQRGGLSSTGVPRSLAEAVVGQDAWDIPSTAKAKTQSAGHRAAAGGSSAPTAPSAAGAGVPHRRRSGGRRYKIQERMASDQPARAGAPSPIRLSQSMHLHHHVQPLGATSTDRGADPRGSASGGIGAARPFRIPASSPRLPNTSVQSLGSQTWHGQGRSERKGPSSPRPEVSNAPVTAWRAADPTSGLLPDHDHHGQAPATPASHSLPLSSTPSLPPIQDTGRGLLHEPGPGGSQRPDNRPESCWSEERPSRRSSLISSASTPGSLQSAPRGSRSSTCRPKNNGLSGDFTPEHPPGAPEPLHNAVFLPVSASQHKQGHRDPSLHAPPGARSCLPPASLVLPQTCSTHSTLPSASSNELSTTTPTLSRSPSSRTPSRNVRPERTTASKFRRQTSPHAHAANPKTLPLEDRVTLASSLMVPFVTPSTTAELHSLAETSFSSDLAIVLSNPSKAYRLQGGVPDGASAPADSPGGSRPQSKILRCSVGSGRLKGPPVTIAHDMEPPLSPVRTVEHPPLWQPDACVQEGTTGKPSRGFLPDSRRMAPGPRPFPSAARQVLSFPHPPVLNPGLGLAIKKSQAESAARMATVQVQETLSSVAASIPTEFVMKSRIAKLAAESGDSTVLNRHVSVSRLVILTRRLIGRVVGEAFDQWKTFLRSNRLLSRGQAAVLIAKHIKGYLARRNFRLLKEADERRERALAADLERHLEREIEEAAATTVLMELRKQQAQASLLRFVYTWRTVRKAREFTARALAARSIQSAWRCFLARRSLLGRILESLLQNRAVTQVQAHFRGRVARRKAKALKLRRQRLKRDQELKAAGFVVHEGFMERGAAAVLTRWWRHRLMWPRPPKLQRHLIEPIAAVRIQRVTRGFLFRRTWPAMRENLEFAREFRLWCKTRSVAKAGIAMRKRAIAVRRRLHEEAVQAAMRELEIAAERPKPRTGFERFASALPSFGGIGSSPAALKFLRVMGLRNKHDAARCIQRAWRAKVSRRRFHKAKKRRRQRIRGAATKITKVARGFVVRVRLRRWRTDGAATRIARIWRGFHERRLLHARRARLACALFLQRHWRGHRGRQRHKRFKELKLLSDVVSVPLQANAKRRRAQRETQELVERLRHAGERKALTEITIAYACRLFAEQLLVDSVMGFGFAEGLSLDPSASPGSDDGRTVGVGALGRGERRRSISKRPWLKPMIKSPVFGIGSPHASAAEYTGLQGVGQPTTPERKAAIYSGVGAVLFGSDGVSEGGRSAVGAAPNLPRVGSKKSVRSAGDGNPSDRRDATPASMGTAPCDVGVATHEGRHAGVPAVGSASKAAAPDGNPEKQEVSGIPVSSSGAGGPDLTVSTSASPSREGVLLPPSLGQAVSFPFTTVIADGDLEAFCSSVRQALMDAVLRLAADSEEKDGQRLGAKARRRGRRVDAPSKLVSRSAFRQFFEDPIALVGHSLPLTPVILAKTYTSSKSSDAEGLSFSQFLYTLQRAAELRFSSGKVDEAAAEKKALASKNSVLKLARGGARDRNTPQASGVPTRTEACSLDSVFQDQHHLPHLPEALAVRIRSFASGMSLWLLKVFDKVMETSWAAAFVSALAAQSFEAVNATAGCIAKAWRLRKDRRAQITQHLSRTRKKLHSAATRIQAGYRWWKAAQRVQRLAVMTYQELMDPESGRTYYVNPKTRGSFWTRPALLRGSEPYTKLTVPQEGWDLTVLCCMCETLIAAWECAGCNSAFCPKCFRMHHGYNARSRNETLAGQGDTSPMKRILSPQAVGSPESAAYSPMKAGSGMEASTPQSPLATASVEGAGFPSPTRRAPDARSPELTLPLLPQRLDAFAAFEILEEKKKAARSDGGKGLGPESPPLHWAVKISWCSECGYQAASHSCNECLDFFCDACFEASHSRGNSLEHSFESLVPMCENCHVRAAKFWCHGCQKLKNRPTRPRARMRRGSVNALLDASEDGVIVPFGSPKAPWPGNGEPRAGEPNDWAGEEEFEPSGGFCTTMCFDKYHMELSDYCERTMGIMWGARGGNEKGAICVYDGTRMGGSLHTCVSRGYASLEMLKGLKADWQRQVLERIAARLEKQDRVRRRGEYAERRTRMASIIQETWRKYRGRQDRKADTRKLRLARRQKWEETHNRRLNLVKDRKSGLLVEKFSVVHEAKDVARRAWTAIHNRVDPRKWKELRAQQRQRRLQRRKRMVEESKVGDWMRMGKGQGDLKAPSAASSGAGAGAGAGGSHEGFEVKRNGLYSDYGQGQYGGAGAPARARLGGTGFGAGSAAARSSKRGLSGDAETPYSRMLRK